MVFHCQRNCFSTEYYTTVVSCKKSKVQLVQDETVTPEASTKTNNGSKCVSKKSHDDRGGGAANKKKPKEVDCFEVIFEDTVLFPEGGGQPDDRGTIIPLLSDNYNDSENIEANTEATKTEKVISTANGCGNYVIHVEKTATIQTGDNCTEEKLHITSDVESLHIMSADEAIVLRVLRRGGEAVHYLDKPLHPGTLVLQRLDWPRRKDHMQQHSAQHLISALAETKFGYATTSWSLGAVTSNIELHTTQVTVDQLSELERETNDVIAKALPVTVTEHSQGEYGGAHIRGLPADVVGAVRVVSIEGVDSNMCCGTHVSNTAQLHAVKLLGVEPGKASKTLLTFVAGDRLLRYLSNCYTQQRSLTTLLHTHPYNFVNIVEKLQSNLKNAEKSNREALRDLATSQALLWKNNAKEEDKLWCHHRRLGDADYLNALVTACDDENILKILTAGEDKGPALLVIHGPQEAVAYLGPRLCNVLDGKGGGKSRFSARVCALGRREEAYKIARQYFSELSQPGVM